MGNKRRVLPSFSEKEFLEQVYRGPGFGCWTIGRVRRAFRKLGKKRITARDVAQYCLGNRRLWGSTDLRHGVAVMVACLDVESARELLREVAYVAYLDHLWDLPLQWKGRIVFNRLAWAIPWQENAVRYVANVL